MPLPANCGHRRCSSTNVRLRGAITVTQTASFFDAIKQIEHRNNTEHTREQGENGLHISLVVSRTCCHCAVPHPAAPATSLSDDFKSGTLRLTLISLPDLRRSFTWPAARNRPVGHLIVADINKQMLDQLSYSQLGCLQANSSIPSMQDIVSACLVTCVCVDFSSA